MKFTKITFLVLAFGAVFLSCAKKEEKEEAGQVAGRDIWTAEAASQWYEKQGWLVGCDFLPSTAINQLEMWQEESFDTTTINRELGWAAGLGMNTIRVYLHDLLFEQDSAGFLKRMDTFLDISARHGIKPLFVLFDSCWDPFPRLGVQREPTPFVHNSGWVQSPGIEVLKDSTQYGRLQEYVRGVIGHFAGDQRVLGWDIWNEPDNTNGSSYGKVELPGKAGYVYPILKEAFKTARSVNPTQPLTAGVWQGDWSAPERLSRIDSMMLAESDVISFHNYHDAASFDQRIEWLAPLGRPLLCTEYMSRGNGSTFEGSLPIAKKYNVAAYNWGLVDGKSQTIYPWDSWKKKYTGEPELWFHDIFRKDGTPYKKSETDLIRQLTGKSKE